MFLKAKKNILRKYKLHVVLLTELKGNKAE